MMKSDITQISVILCSRNRAEQVSRCLERLDVAELANVNGELVLVDSASSDNTRQVFYGFHARHPNINIRVCTAEKKGLSIARNMGVENTHAGLIVFLDDDVYLEQGYLANVISLFEEQAPCVGIAGGRILRFDPEDSLYCCQLNEQYKFYKKGSMVRPGALQGSNFAIRRACFDDIRGFDEELGAGQKYRCEDIDFIARALQANWEAVYDPKLVVYHHHGRQDGEDVEMLRKDNSYAAGAFIAKMQRQGYRKYWLLLVLYVLSAPIRPNTKIVSLLKGWRDYRDDYPPGEIIRN